MGTRRWTVHAVATEASDPPVASLNHLTYVLQDVSITRVECRERGARKIDLEIAKQIVASHELIRER